MMHVIKLCIIASLICVNGHAELIQVIMVTRHGNRTPIVKLPLDHLTKTPGVLTAEGYSNAFHLGNKLRTLYMKQTPLLSPQYSSNELYVRSSDTDRCIQTANAILAGLYGTATLDYDMPNSQILEEFQRHPIPPVHTVPSHRDHLLKGHKNCRNFWNRWKSIVESNEFKEGPRNDSAFAIEDLEKFIVDFRQKTGINSTILEILQEFDDLGDPIVVFNQQTQLDRPSSILNSMNEEFIKNVEKLFRWQWGQKFYGPHCSTYCSGALLHDMLQHLKRTKSLHEQSTEIPNKFVLYAGHDIPLMGLLYAFSPENVDPTEIPSFLGNFVIELHHDPTIGYFVNIRRNLEEVTLSNCKGTCLQLHHFEEHMIEMNASVEPDQWDLLCENKHTNFAFDDTLDGTKTQKDQMHEDLISHNYLHRPSAITPGTIQLLVQHSILVFVVLAILYGLRINFTVLVVHLTQLCPNLPCHYLYYNGNKQKWKTAEV